MPRDEAGRIDLTEPPIGRTLDPVRRGLRRLPAFDFRDIRPTGNVLNLVDGVLGAGGLSYLIGASRAGKSFLAVDIGAAISRGVYWRNRKTTPGVVVYVAAEGGHGMCNRVEAYRRGHGMATDENVPFVLIPASLDLMWNADDAKALIETCHAAAKRFDLPLALIIIDTLHRVYAGANEDGTAEAGRFLRLVDRIREATGAHVMVVHHFGKDPARGARGSGAHLAGADTEITLQPVAGADHVAATVTKQKDGPDGAVFGFRLRLIEIGMDEDGRAMTCPIVEHVDSEVTPQRKKEKPLKAEDIIALDALQDALARSGVTPAQAGQSIDIPPSVTNIVHRDVWRDMAYRKGLGDPTDENRRKVFQRALQSLKSRRIVGISGDYMWVVG